MITIIIKRNKQQEIVSYRVTGHAKTAPHGEDIVCAAVSVLAQTTILGFYQVLNQQPEYQITDGNLNCKIKDSLTATQRKEATILLETMLVGLKNIQQQYPKIIAIEDEEV